MNPHTAFSSSPIEMMRSFVKHRHLIWQMTKRDVVGRYRGSVLGLAWSFFNPLVMLAVYTFVFSVVFNARWNMGTGSKTEFALALFIGMIIHSIVAESIIKAPGLMLNNVSYVKKVVFPLEILPWVSMGSTLFHAIVSLIVWGVVYLGINGSIQITIFYLPVIVIPLVLCSMGMSWFLAALGVYLRDVGQITGVIATMLLFMSPVFYPASILPEAYKTILYLNPLTFFIEQARAVLMWGQSPNWIGVGVSYVVSFLIAWIAFVWFQKTRRGFADVL